MKCIENEIPFELPEGWAWARLGNIGEIITGGTPSKSHHEYYGNAFPFFKPADLDQGRKTIISSEYLSEKGKSCCRIIPKFSTAVCCIGSIGKCGYLNVEGTTNQQINSVIPNIDSLYAYYYCSSDYFLEQLLSLASATTIAIVNKSKMESVLIPVPPMVEQQRIANTLDTALGLIETLEVEKSDIIVSINNVKSKILDLAIRGKLVPQDSNDEPASVLLERIREEKEKMIEQGKIKRDKKESVIFKGDDNSYYGIHLPGGWNWAILKDISFSISDGSHNPPLDKGFGVPLLSAANINNNSVQIDNPTRWITNEEWEIENQRTNIEIGDVLLTIVGSIGRSAVVETNERFALQRSVAVIKPCLISPFYLMYIFQTPQIQKWLDDNSKGTAQKGIYLNALSTMAVPVPPLEEQSRIVEQITIAFEQLDLISNALH